ncbi:MAG: hypothetical protein M1822_007780 [Bathelium mastoideum]|nr:MAG: hypothetical protein M1822_007780 [Bathelium mastoideum]
MLAYNMGLESMRQRWDKQTQVDICWSYTFYNYSGTPHSQSSRQPFCYSTVEYFLCAQSSWLFIPFYTALASTNVITDVILLVLPMPEIYKLQIPWQKKIGLVVVFTLGIFVCAIAVYRITTLKEIDPKDITWSNTYAGLWTAIEGSVVSLQTYGTNEVSQQSLPDVKGVTVACLPSSVPVFLQAFGKYRRERSQRSNYGSHGRGTQHSSKAMWSRTEHDGFNKMDNLSLNSGEEHSLGFKVGPTAGVERNTDQRSIPLQGIVVTRAIDQEVD